jgi:transcriptional regulator with XRE-family HTH domain
VKNQILKIIETEGLTPARFADEIGVQRSSISHIISGRNKPSYDFIIKILNRFSGINAEWLVTGKGNMIKNEPSGLKTNQTSDLFSAQLGKTASESSKQPGIGAATNAATIQSTIQSGIAQEFTKTNKNHEVTNVNNIEQVLIFYKDGTFKSYTPEK